MHIHGRNPVIEALLARREITKIYLRFGAHGDAVEQVRRLARERGVPVVTLDKQKFDRLGGGAAAQGIVAFIEDVPTVSLGDLLAPREQDPVFLVAMDQITDPHNAGAIIRSAECAGAHGVILPSHGAAPLTEVVVKAAAGATAHLPIARVGNLHQALLELKEAGVWIAGLDGDGEVDLFALDGFRSICLVVGAEGRGLRQLTRKTCDFLVRIPMWGRVSSLNASVAAALALYEVRRKRI